MIKTPKIRKVDVLPGNYLTTWMTYSTTCHKYYRLSDDSDKKYYVCVEDDYCAI
jgi:hypothetical protein